MDEQPSNIDRMIRTSLDRLLPRLEAEFASRFREDTHDWEIFLQRLQDNFPSLFSIYYRLYSNHYDFFYHLQDLLYTLANMWTNRPSELKLLDIDRERKPDWFQSQEMLGGVCYVDLFAETLNGVREKIHYFKELGLTYLHLMPLFRVPEGENDGGYAVSSYREVDPRLGTMEQLSDLAADLRNAGISLVLDLVFNHTSDEHEWAKKAIDGDLDYQDYYWVFPDRKMPDAYEAHLREIFPDEHPGAFTYREDMGKWVWTTFHAYQWDLNYSNPVVFNRMAEEMLFLANIGVEVLRLDAVAFIWKQLGTSCENLPQAHLLIQAFNSVARISSPALLFKSEAIVHPDEVVRYISPQECQLSYNPLLMALLWNSLATREVRLLNLACSERFGIGENCSWVNYVRCHDDIGWTFSDEDASRLGINGYHHRRFLNDFYTGRFEGSFSRGLPFQENPKTGDARISGTCASLGGLEKGIKENDAEEISLAIKRVLLIHAIILTIGGIPLIYLGDEIGTLNDYQFSKDPAKADDSRWVHRPFMDWELAAHRINPDSIPGQIFLGLQKIINLRKKTPALAGNDLQVMNTGSDHVLGYVRIYKNQKVLIFANFSEHQQTIMANQLRLYGLGYQYNNLITNEVLEFKDLILQPYEFLCLSA
jgi:amylosucrase